MQSIYTLLDINTKNYPNKTALIVNEERITYQELGRKINRLAYSLDHLIGIRYGDRVGFLFPNGEDFVVIFYALQKIGAVAVPFNFRFSLNEIKENINACECDYFIYDKKFKDCVAEISIEVDCVKKFIHTGKLGIQGEFDLGALINAGDPEWDYQYTSNPMDDALFVFTGGTTGAAKAAIHSQESLILKVTLRAMGEARFCPEDVFLNYSPMFHLAGLIYLMGILTACACMVIAIKFETDDLLRFIAREKVTHFFLIPPTICEKIYSSKLLPDTNLQSVRCVILGGSAHSTKMIEDTFRIFPNASIMTGYSHSENAAVTYLYMNRQEFSQNRERSNSIGKVQSFSQIKLMDDFGHEVKVGEAGEAWAKCPAQMKGYLKGNYPFIDGWLPTGDILKQDSDGYFYFLDRKKDLIKSGGEIVYAIEVENVLKTHPAVEDCAVVGLCGTHLGEFIVAAVIQKEGFSATESEIIDYCWNKIASYKKPKRVVFLKEFPRSAVGKVNKVHLRAILYDLVVCE